MPDDLRPRLYVDLISQPSRAVVIFSKMNQLDIDIRFISIGRGDTKKESYQRELNGLGKVPFLYDPSLFLHLPESAAILCYLADRYRVPDHWYPSGQIYPSLRAIVNSALHWWHSNIRAGCARLVFHTVIGARLGAVVNKAIAEEGKDILHQSLDTLQSYWLKGGESPFLCGSQISIADLLMSCELEQVCMLTKEVHGTDLDDQLKDRPVIKEWMKRVRGTCGEAYEEAHKPLWKSAQSSKVSSKL